MPRLLAAVALLGLWCVGCPHPGPDPVPPTPAPVAFVCAGPSSVPSFDAVANEVINAAQREDDGDAFAALDAVASKRGGADVVRCVIGEILPDLRAAPVSGVHIEAWQAAHQ